MDIINMSLGGSSDSSILEEWCNTAYNSGLLVVAAAGNSGNRAGKNDSVGYPAKYASVIAVAAIDQNNNRASFSSTGPAVELSAPGVDVLSTVPGNLYDSYNGTSMASPHVARVAALVWAAKPGLTNVELRQLLRDSAMNLGDAIELLMTKVTRFLHHRLQRTEYVLQRLKKAHSVVPTVIILYAYSE
jgi:subtilisin